MLKTLSGADDVYRAGTEHDFDDDEAQALIDAEIAEPAGKQPPKPKPAKPEPQPPAAAIETPISPWGSPAYLAAWDELDEADVVAGINAWGTGTGTADNPAILKPPPDLITVIREHEAAHGNRQEVLDALDTALNEQPTRQPETPPAPTAAELVEQNSRAQLNKLAKKAGVKNAEKLKDKTAVAEAIIAAGAAG